MSTQQERYEEHQAKLAAMPLPQRLRAAYGKNVPEGDGWSWEWETDELAEIAAKRIEELEARPSLFQKGEFILASGQQSGWKIECEALTDEDWACLGMLLAARLPNFQEVLGVPTGGEKLAAAMRQYASPPAHEVQMYRILVVDDVFTTGKSMGEFIDKVAEEREYNVMFYKGVVFDRSQYGIADAYSAAVFRISP